LLAAASTSHKASFTALAASGRVVLPDFSKPGDRSQPIDFDLRGQILNVDLRRLPRNLNIPPADTNVDADYRVAGRVVQSRTTLNGDARFHASTIAGAKIAKGSTAEFSVSGDDVAYAVDATVSDLDLERVGRAFNVAALAEERYRSSINGHVVARGRGADPQRLDVTANGALTDTTLLGGAIPALTFDVALAEDTVHVKANGTFNGFDPAALSGKPELKGAVGGNLDVNATLAAVSHGVTPDSVTATARVNLDQSNIGGLQITKAVVDADYRDSSGEIRSLEITGHDLNVAASGTLALNQTGQSNLELHADSPSLETIGKLVDVPLTGIAKVDATITGNRSELKAAGNLTGDGVKYQENGALTASTDFTVTIPDLDTQRAAVSANTHATFVSIAGQNINELTAKTEYTDKQVNFEATAKQPQRSLAASGNLLLHPDHQEVHLTSLGLQSKSVQWQTAGGSSATINYANEAVSVTGLRLVNGDQEITADGQFGRPGDSLNVTLNNIDVATVDALLLREPQLTGRLNASAKVAGTKEAPSVDAKFTIDHGAFLQFKYDTLGGTAAYAASGVDVDARLQQNPTTWMTAGYAPFSRRPQEELRPACRQPAG
jgi:hypothetical protein